MADVTIISGGLTGNSMVRSGITFYQWSYTVNVDGQVGVVDEWVDTNNPADDADIRQDVIDDVQENGLGGVADGSDGSDGSDGVVAADGSDGGTDGDGDGADGGDGGGDGGGGNGGSESA